LDIRLLGAVSSRTTAIITSIASSPTTCNSQGFAFHTQIPSGFSKGRCRQCNVRTVTITNKMSEP
jgi:hypothetical protein